MAITKEQLRQKVLEVKQGWLDNNFEDDLDTILEVANIDFENEENNYRPAYPLFAAILQHNVDSAIYGSSYERTRRETKRKMQKYLATNFWLNHGWLKRYKEDKQ